MHRLKQLQELFPEAFDDGVLSWRRLQHLLTGVETGAATEISYGLQWEGRSEAEQESFIPSTCRWQPVAEESVAFETTEHLMIEGDNLDALKHLQRDYQDQVKFIYIDPPYNTGQRFSYKDNYRQDLRSYLRDVGQSYSNGSTKGTSSPSPDWHGRLHASWLTMMYPRLTLARQLLAPNGAIFVSIDDNEYHNLRYLMDEIFGPENFVANVVWRKKVVRGRGAAHIIPQTEYILIYARQIALLPPFTEPITEKMRKEYRHSDENGSYKRIPLAKSGTSHSPRPNLVYTIEAPDGSPIPCPTHQWRWSQETLEENREQIEFRKGRDGKWRVYTKQYLYVDGEARRKTPPSYYDNYTTTDGTQDMKALFGEVVLDFPKPVGLIQDLIVWLTGTTPHEHDIILDFFAGSGTTGEAVLRLNQADGGNRRFILVQIPAPTPPKSAAARAGFATIAELCKDRLRRVLNQLSSTHVPDKADAQPPDNSEATTYTPDLGFRVIRLINTEPVSS